MEKSKVMDKEAIERTIMRMAHEILEKNKGTENLCLVGIRSRGVYIAKRLAECIYKIDNVRVPVGILDITLYRDDLTKASSLPVVHKTEIDFDVTDKNLVLVDDVLYAGRTIRAAMDALIDLGRPNSWLFWWTGATGSCRYARIMSGKIFLPRKMKQLKSG